MRLDNEDRTRQSSPIRNSPPLSIIEISSDSEDIVFQPHTRNHKHPGLGFWRNDVIELTDSDLGNSSDLPDTLSPLVKGARTKKAFGSRKQSPSKKFVPLYIDTSDEGEPDNDSILLLNDPPSSRKPIRRIAPAKDQNNAKGIPFLHSPEKNVVPFSSQAAPRSPNKGQTRRAREQARRENYAAELFSELNKDVFGDRLPKDTTLEWNKRLLTTAGRARWHRSRTGEDSTKIELASKILDCDDRIQNTLSHEMCHLACWVIDNQPREGHGQLFKSWANKVMNKFPNIHISTRHNYEISYPYEWKCEKCMKIYGRYSKSIRPDECVCGACKVGKLIPLTSKISRLAMNPRNSSNPLSRNVDDNDVMGLVTTFGVISIDNTRDT